MWSTRQLAELAGATVKTVRHYHRLRLLDEPERMSNGYKQYGPAHLVRLLQVKQMSERGIPLAQIRAMATSTAAPDTAFEVLDAELEATIARLLRVRAQLALIREHRVPLDTPSPFESVAQGLSEDYRGLLTVFSRVLDDGALADIRELMSEPDDASEPFDALTDESDDAAVDRVAALLAVSMTAHRERFPWTAQPVDSARPDGDLAREALVRTVAEVFNRGQLRALAVAHSLVARPDPGGEGSRPGPGIDRAPGAGSSLGA
ncbi:MerR family transcriptional regulator [Mycobacterium sp. WMMD1722]|uniref:MerR family transcriptional regulator n=1 Tax=Mycobacterium sp. WMMD1722 TaxID=3404117 RepID=UPI003BF5A4F1